MVYHVTGKVMSNHTPEEVLRSIVEGINTGNIDSVLMLYDPEACFTLQPGQVVKGQQSIRQNLRFHRHERQVRIKSEESTLCRRSCSSNQ